MIKVLSERSFRLFRVERHEAGRRIGFQPNTLARIAVLRKMWGKVRQEISELEPQESFPRSASFQELRSREWVFDEETGKTHECYISVTDPDYVLVKDHARPLGPMLSIQIDVNDYEDVRVTTYLARKLSPGEVIADGDQRLAQPEDPDPFWSREREAVPHDWIGQPFAPEVHQKVLRPREPDVARESPASSPRWQSLTS